MVITDISLLGLDMIHYSRSEDQMTDTDTSNNETELLLSGTNWSQELMCSLCRRLFGSPEKLKEHEYQHTLMMALSLDGFEIGRPAVSNLASLVPPGPQGRYFCSQCPSSFTLKSNADRHEKTIHFKRKMMQCDFCLKHFRDRTDLNRHLSSVHSRERIFTCSICSKSFSTQKNLATHMKVCYQSNVMECSSTWNIHGLKEGNVGSICRVFKFKYIPGIFGSVYFHYSFRVAPTAV
ncbi:zinc finger and BTB domain-containing protein 46-like isoform X1 [Acipenser oxyrinchus oxyrinchus]|uniref:Zinc finger and BTB domain-containing protein 46-like isoform X1 n=1 Tax=Acipenser oxyrinchus oxyrinchus TaxID=40147 RepID=A0AAD8FW71_ACIOX|nr:zinc finger and BTB domain-containing protein 46-like isoform X1 [Acipenser oxyrinchus oxyrinchus]